MPTSRPQVYGSGTKRMSFGGSLCLLFFVIFERRGSVDKISVLYSGSGVGDLDA